MTFLPFNILYESGSEFVVTDPTLNQRNKFYLISASGATSESWYWDDNNPYPAIDVFGRNRIVWAGYLSKFITQTVDMPYISTDGLVWVSSSAENEANRVQFGLVSADDLNIVVSCRSYTDLFNYRTTSSVSYSTDGIIWNIGTASANMSTKGIAYSPTLQKFVTVGECDTGVATAYSSNGINFIVVSGSSIQSESKMVDFTDVTWDSSGSQFVAIGLYKEGLGSDNSCSIHTSTDGQTWTLKNTVRPPIDYAGFKFYRIVAVSGSYVMVGDAANNGGTGSMLRSTNLTGWEFVQNLPTKDLYDISYSPILNRFVAVGEMSRYSGPLYSDDTINWYTGSFSPYAYDELANIVWSPSLNEFVMLGVYPFGQTYRSYDGTKFFTKNESYTGSIRFSDSPAGTIYNTLLTPWSSSNAVFEKDTAAYTWIEIDIARGPANPNDNTSDNIYFLTSSYGIIIDSASLTGFDGYYPAGETEDVIVDGIRYLQEITTDYETTAYGYYETPISSVVTSATTATFSGSFKESGRAYFVMYYGVYGNVTSDVVAMIVNLNNGTIEYSEDESTRNDIGSYNLSSGKLNFIHGPTMTSKCNNYWELAFKVGFINEQTRSGSVLIT